jgi:hypothetical protein
MVHEENIKLQFRERVHTSKNIIVQTKTILGFILVDDILKERKAYET